MKSWFEGVVYVGATAWLLAAAPALARQQSAQGSEQPKQQQKQEAQKKNAQNQATPAQRVELDEVEENPSRYMGRAITVNGEIDEVLGPRVFKIDETNWADMDGELLVVMPVPMAALVNDNERVTVTGTLRPFVRADVEREWGFLGLDPSVELNLKAKPVIVASSVVSTEDNTVLAIASVPAGGSGTHMSGEKSGGAQATGTSGTSSGKSRADAASPVTDATTLAKATDNKLVGRRVKLTSVKIEAKDKNGGFWVSAGGERLYVLPSAASVSANAGQTVSIDGYVLRMPEQMEQRLENDRQTGNEEIYVYADSIT